MEDNFLTAFNVEEPVYAKKSAAPPPPMDDESSMMADENMAAAANGVNTAANAVPEQPLETEEPMDQDNQADPLVTPPAGDPELGQGKKARSRSRARRAEKRLDSKSPDVNKLLETLNNQQQDHQQPHLPPLPTTPTSSFAPPPPPPPPPGLPARKSDVFEEGEGGSRQQKIPAKGSRKNNKKADPPRTPGGSQRTSGVQPPSGGDPGRSHQSNVDGGLGSNSSSSSSNSGSNVGSSSDSSGFQSYNRQWTAGHGGGIQPPGSDPPEQAGAGAPHGQSRPTQNRGMNKESSSASGSAAGGRGGFVYSYGTKPNGRNEMCTDITSFRFTPDDDLKVNIALRKMRGDALEKSSFNNEKHVLHQLPAILSSEVTGVPLTEAPGATSIEDTKDRFLSVADFASQETNAPTVFHTIAKRDAIVFVIVSRPVGARGKLAWEFPALSKCQDYSNDFISQIYEGNNSWARAYVRSGKWGKLGTILLSSSDMDELAEFRRQFALLSYRNESFDMFPKDALTAKADVSILLRGSMKTFKTEIIPTVLFARNKDTIAGSLRVMSTTFYSAEELSHKGEPKQFWRSIDLKGDDQFMRCLRFVPDSHSFLLGYDSVQIRGGLRPQESNFAIAGNKRPWADIPPPSVPLLRDPRHIFPTSDRDSQPDESSARGAAKRGRGGRGGRRGDRGGRGRRGRQ